MHISRLVPLLLVSSLVISSAEPGSCLEKYDGRIGDLLPKDRLAGLVDLGTVEPKQDVRLTGLLTTVAWTWPSERKRILKIAGREMEAPVPNQVAITNFKRLDTAKRGPKDGKTYVEQNYRSISEEEMKQMAEGMRKSIEERVKKGEITAEQGKMAGGLGGDLMGKERVVETIAEVGDACRWTESDNLLAVGHRNVFFTVTVDISTDKAVNRAKAIELAKVVLAECD